MVRLSPLVLAPVVLLLSTAIGAADVPAFERLLHVRVPMRDGIHLDTHVFHPLTAERFPAVLVRTPYGKGADLLPSYYPFLNRGYAVVVQDVRGRWASEGVFDFLDQEGRDGYDTLNWIARQLWSDGRIGMVGGSYLGIAQWRVAALDNPHLKAIFPVVSGDDDYLDRFYSPGGASKLGHRLLWLSDNLLAPGVPRPAFNQYVAHLPLRSADRAATGQTIDGYQQALDHPTYDAFWHHLSVRDKLDRVKIPVFIVGGWYDNYVESDLAAFSTLSHEKSASPGAHRIIVGPWPHNMALKFPSVDYGPESGAPIRAYQLDWFDQWVKGPGEPLRENAVLSKARFEPSGAPVRIFVMGINQWREEPEWPLARARETPLYLGGKGHANGLRGDGALDWKASRKERQDQYIYDPARPVPTQGGAVCCNPKIFPWGPMDQRRVEERDDVLVYSTKPLKRPIEVTGAVRVKVFVSTTATDTDFTAKLMDVFPTGEARNLTDGILRLRYREGLDKAVLAKPGEVYPVVIDAGVTSNVFLPGHRIRLEISSSNFPRFDRNPNTGRVIATEISWKKARQVIFHGAEHASCVLLPVVAELTAANSTRYGSKRSPPKALTYKAR